MPGITINFDLSLAIGWVLGRAALITLLLVLAHGLRSATKRIVPRIIKTAVLKSAEPDTVDELTKRYLTLSDATTKTFDVTVWVVVIFTSLSMLGIDIAPILAAVGVVGIAIGFGAQSLVKDILAGLFILLENQYGKGDVVKIGPVSGQVEDVNLRRTVLRDQDGTVHHIPNGEVRIASNLTRNWSRVNFKLNVAYTENIEQVFAAINRVGEALASDPLVGSLIVEAPKALRVDGFEEAGVAILIRGVTRPMKQWEVASELRIRLKAAFEEEGIAMAYAPAGNREQGTGNRDVR